MKAKKFLLFIIFPALLFSLAGLYLYFRIDAICFEKISEDFFEESLENDILNLHYTLAEPENYGILCQDPALPVYSRESSAQSAESLRLFLTKMDVIRPERLSETDRYTYELLSSYLSAELEGTDFSYYEEPLSPSSGMHTELPLLLAEYTFRDKADVSDYLSLLESIPAYLEGLTTFETEKADAGLFMPEEDAFQAAAQCDAILEEDQLLDHRHFLQTTFESRLETLMEGGEITQQEQALFVAENDRLLTTLILPAYQKLGDDLIILSEKSTAPGGLCRLPDGKNYYAWLVRHATGCQISTEELYALLQRQFRKTYEHLQAQVAAYRELTGNAPDFTVLTEHFSITDPSEILTDLQEKMALDFPTLSDLTDQEIVCTIKDVDDALEAFTSPAYYMTPPVDDLVHNTICINRSSTDGGVELYTTLAHEGYPGHLYQTVYSTLASTFPGETPIRELLYYGGYTEGWAYYAERISYEYAAQLLAADSGGGTENADAAALLCEIAAAQRDLQVNLYCLLDISLHDQGASKDDITRTLSSLGISEDAAEQIYNYLRTSPAVYLKYYVGYLEMLALRSKAEELWGDSFTLLRFHRFILEAGPSDFSNLIKRLSSTKNSAGTADAVSFFQHTFHIASVPE